MRRMMVSCVGHVSADDATWDVLFACRTVQGSAAGTYFRDTARGLGSFQGACNYIAFNTKMAFFIFLV